MPFKKVINRQKTWSLMLMRIWGERCSYYRGANVKWYNCNEVQSGNNHQNLKKALTQWPNNSISQKFSTHITAHVQNKICAVLLLLTRYCNCTKWWLSDYINYGLIHKTECIILKQKSMLLCTDKERVLKCIAKLNK